MSAAATTSFTDTAALESVSDPAAAGIVSTVTLASVSPVSPSKNVKSPVRNV